VLTSEAPFARLTERFPPVGLLACRTAGHVGRAARTPVPVPVPVPPTQDSGAVRGMLDGRHRGPVHTGADLPVTGRSAKDLFASESPAFRSPSAGHVGLEASTGARCTQAGRGLACRSVRSPHGDWWREPPGSRRWAVHGDRSAEKGRRGKAGSRSTESWSPRVGLNLDWHGGGPPAGAAAGRSMARSVVRAAVRVGPGRE
jgi:hypothetical protein